MMVSRRRIPVARPAHSQQVADRGRRMNEESKKRAGITGHRHNHITGLKAQHQKKKKSIPSTRTHTHTLFYLEEIGSMYATIMLGAILVGEGGQRSEYEAQGPIRHRVKPHGQTLANIINQQRVVSVCVWTSIYFLDIPGTLDRS